MRTTGWLRGALAVGGVLLLVGLAWGFGSRVGASHAGPIVLLVAGAVLTVGSAVLLALRTMRGVGLAGTHRRLPELTLGAGCFGAGLVLLLSGPLVSAWLGLVGVLLLAAACLAYARVLDPHEAPHEDLRVVRAAKRLVTFAELHGLEGDTLPVAVERLGEWHRIVAVGADGTFGDVMVRGAEHAERAIELAGATVHDQTDAALFGAVRTGPYEWRRMADSQLRPLAPPRRA